MQQVAQGDQSARPLALFPEVCGQLDFQVTAGRKGRVYVRVCVYFIERIQAGICIAHADAYLLKHATSNGAVVGQRLTCRDAGHYDKR